MNPRALLQKLEQVRAQNEAAKEPNPARLQLQIQLEKLAAPFSPSTEPR